MLDVGIWIQQDEDKYECSFCGYESSYVAEYCPSCQTYMVIDEDVY